MPKQHPNVKALRDLKRLVGDSFVGQQPAGDLLDWAIRVCENADNLVNVKGRHHSELAYRRLEEAVNGGSHGAG